MDVQRNKYRLAEDVGHNPQGLDEVERSTGVESAGRVVKAQDVGTRRHHLGDGHALPLSPRDATHKLITDEGVRSVRDVEHA